MSLKPSQATFPKAFRLNDPSDFSGVFECAGFRRRRDGVRMTARINEQSGPRLGLVVGKRALRLAVDRNRARRVIRECFRVSRSDLPAFDIVVQVVTPVDRDALRIMVQSLFDELRRAAR